MPGTDATHRKEAMIIVTRLNGEALAVNADLIERIEAMPDTVVTFVDGKKLLVRDTVDELIDKVLQYRAAILHVAYGTLDADPTRHAPPATGRPASLHLVVDPAAEHS